MSAHLFKSMNGTKQSFEPTPEDMARDLALELILGIKERRQAAREAELRCEPSLQQTEEDKQRYDALEALLKGRHRQAVLALLLTHFPEWIAEMKVN